MLSRLPVAEAAAQALIRPTGPDDELLVGVVEAPGLNNNVVPASWGWDPHRWRELQRSGDNLVTISTYLECGALPPAAKRRTQTPTVKNLLSQWGRLSLREGVLYRSVHDAVTHDVVFQVVVCRGGDPSWQESGGTEAK